MAAGTLVQLVLSPIEKFLLAEFFGPRYCTQGFHGTQFEKQWVVGM
jgi:hypothetical protein